MLMAYAYFYTQMKRYFALFGLLMFSTLHSTAQNGKIVSDFTVVYDVILNDNADPQIVKAMNGATKTLYIKGSKSRSELVSPNFQQSIIFDAKSDSTIVLREVGSTKYISFLNSDKRNDVNKKYDGIAFVNTDETKTILGYECKKVLAKLNDGSTFNVYYTLSIIPSNREYEYQFRELPGFVLEYEAEAESGKVKVKYSASKITLSPVSSAKFDVPKAGYRVL